MLISVLLCKIGKPRKIPPPTTPRSFFFIIIKLFSPVLAPLFILFREKPLHVVCHVPCWYIAVLKLKIVLLHGWRARAIFYSRVVMNYKWTGERSERVSKNHSVKSKSVSKNHKWVRITRVNKNRTSEPTMQLFVFIVSTEISFKQSCPQR